MRPEDENELTKRLAGLPRSGQVAGYRNLGYRGFVIANLTEDNGTPTEVRVFEGLVTTKGKTNVSTFLDTGHLEKWLAEKAREQGLESLIDTVPGLR